MELVRVENGRTALALGGALVISVDGISDAGVTVIIASPGHEAQQFSMSHGNSVDYVGFAQYEVRLTRIDGRSSAEFSIALLGQPSTLNLGKPQALQIAEGSTAYFFDRQLAVSLTQVADGTVTAVLSSPGHPDLAMTGVRVGSNEVYGGNARYSVHVYWTGSGMAAFLVWKLE